MPVVGDLLFVGRERSQIDCTGEVKVENHDGGRRKNINVSESFCKKNKFV